MKWFHVEEFLVARVPRPREDEVIHLDMYKDLHVPIVLDKSLNLLNRFFKNSTEMEAVLRVASFVIGTMDMISSDCDGISIALQPSHPSFTDFLIMSLKATGIRDGPPLAFIEVKKPDISVSLRLENETTAQVLREAQIVLQGFDVGQQIPFVLTNSRLWCFGLAKKCGEKHIKIIDNFNVFLPENPKESNLQVKKLASVLRYVLQGKWIDPPKPPVVDQ